MHNNEAVLRIVRKVLQRELKDAGPLYIDNLIKEVRADIQAQTRCFAATLDMNIAAIDLRREVESKRGDVDRISRHGGFCEEMASCGGSAGFVSKHLVVRAQVTRSQLRALCSRFLDCTNGQFFVLSDTLDLGPAFGGDAPPLDHTPHKLIVLKDPQTKFAELGPEAQARIQRCENVIVISQADHGPASMSYTDLIPKTKLINVGHIHLTYTED